LQYENLTSTAGMAPALRDLKRFLELDPLLPSDDLGLYNYRHQRKTGHVRARRAASDLHPLPLLCRCGQGDVQGPGIQRSRRIATRAGGRRDR
jgi:hypothetical protein